MRFRGDINAGRVTRAFRKAPVLMRDRVDTAAGRAALELSNIARDRAPKAQSNLVNSIKPDKIAPMDYLIGPHVEHGVYMELGVKPGGKMPPLQPLIDWVRVKRISNRDGGSDRDTAWAIARKIQRDGIEPQPYMEPAAEAMEDRSRLLIQQSMRAGLQAEGL